MGEDAAGGGGLARGVADLVEDDVERPVAEDGFESGLVVAVGDEVLDAGRGRRGPRFSTVTRSPAVTRRAMSRLPK